MSKRRRPFHFIHTLITPTIMSIFQFIHNNKSRIVKVLVSILVLIAIFAICIGAKRMKHHSIVIGHPSEIIVISPENSQDVIVIGDPNKVNVKPKKH